jgi:S1-C subfamily serine protease
MKRALWSAWSLAAVTFFASIAFSGLAAEGASKGGKTPEPAKAGSVENSVVKVFSTLRYPDPYRPWTKQPPTEATGTGVIIEGKRILSNAHVVLYASQVQVQANQTGNKLPATVEAIAPGIDLAILKLEDDSFFEEHPPLARASTLPEIKDAVMAYGYPEGGATLSITRGIVSRIEFTLYNGFVSGLRIQIDAAINPGNSGGPAVANEKMIGLAYSHLGGADNIGYIIPCEEIELFLKDVADGRYDGKPALFDELQTLENPALRAFLKLDKSAEGIVVHRPGETRADYPLREWDLITKIGETRVDNQGMITLGANLRVRFSYLVQKLTKDGKVPLTVIRDGKEQTLQVPTMPKPPQVITGLEGAYPSYFVYGPVVFTTATTELVGGMTRGDGAWASWLTFRGSPLIRRVTDKPAFPGESLVVVAAPFFPHRLATGYSSPAGQVVKSINGRAIKNLPHLVEVLRDAKEDYLTIEFDSRGAETVVFRRSEMVASTDDVLSDNGVRTQGSPDTLAVWNGKGAR